MRPIQLFISVLTVFVVLAEPAMAQSVDLSPFVSFFQGIVDAMTGPLGVVLGTLALMGVFASWWFNIIDLRQAIWVLAGLMGIAAAPTIVATVFGA
ncbi:TrbC/VirB2 family protein [Loktanella agnita]|uniref:TrbC/VirB2 family protein n=1 Tax=Loktanella agnita TaxID=287097 RepID=UPI003986A775